MTRAPCPAAITGVASLLESTITISYSRPRRASEMSSMTRATAFSSFMVIIATEIRWLMGDLIDYSDGGVVGIRVIASGNHTAGPTRCRSRSLDGLSGRNSGGGESQDANPLVGDSRARVDRHLPGLSLVP